MNTRFQPLLEDAMARWDVPAAVIGWDVAGETGVVAAGCDAATRFRIASITKPMTATLALRLLSADDDCGVWPGVRVRHLLSHTSGFDCELPDGDNAKFGSGDDALERCVETLPQVRRWVDPEEIWSYANTGYWLAGLLSARAAGTTYEEALARHVLEPAGLEATAFDEPDLVGTGGEAVAGPYPRSRRPSGGLVSNVHDLLRFGRGHLADPASAAMRVIAGKPVGGVYGFGLGGERVGGVEAWGHGGSYGGFQSVLRTVPDRDAVLVGLTNGSKGGKVLAELEDAFFDEVVGARRVRPRFLQPEDGELERFAGVYANNDERIVVEPAGDGLVVHFDDGEHVGLKIGEGTFCIAVGERVDERFDFPRDGLGRFSSCLAAREP